MQKRDNQKKKPVSTLSEKQPVSTMSEKPNMDHKVKESHSLKKNQFKH